MDRALNMRTILTEGGMPYISVIEDEDMVRIQLHAYDDVTKRGVFLHLDKKCLPQLIDIMKEMIDE